MTRTFTQDDLIRYIYGETSPEENQHIEGLLSTDHNAQQQYEDFMEMMKEMDGLSAPPPERVVKKIINFSRGRN